MEVLSDESAGVVGGAVVDDNYVVVGVVLHDYGDDVAEVSAVSFVVEGRDDDAEGNLIVLLYVVFVNIVVQL